MPPSITLSARRHLTWQVHLDMSVRLTPPRDTPEGPARTVILGQEEPSDDTEPGWLVLLDVTNAGWSPVRCADFTSPLSFAFPGRRVLSAKMSPRPASRRTARSESVPTIRVLEGASGSGEPDRVQFAGHFLLRPADGYGITVILTGTPTAGPRPRVNLDGELSKGKVTARPQP